MQTEVPDTAESIHETLYDGADLTVVFKDGHSDTIKVRKIPRSEFGAYAEIISDKSEAGERREAALYCSQTEDWIGRLDDDSFDAILAEGNRLNFTSFARWFRRVARDPRLLENNQHLVNLAMEAMTRMGLQGSTNGSAPSATPTPTSGAGPRKS